MSAAIYWRVDPAPTGRYRSFQKRRWPTAYYKGSDKPAFFIECPESYEPSKVTSGEHAGLTLVACHHNHPNAGNSWARLKFTSPFVTLAACKEAAEQALCEHPEFVPAERPIPEEPERTAEQELAASVLDLLQILAYRKKGGSQLVLNMREPQILSRCAAALGKTGMSEADVLSVVKEAEGWA